MKLGAFLFDLLLSTKTTLQELPRKDMIRKMPSLDSLLKSINAKPDQGSTDPEFISFHVFDHRGCETKQLQIGKDISHELVRKFVDPETGDIYGMTVLENGVATTAVIPKEIWARARQECHEIDQAAKKLMHSTLQDMCDQCTCKYTTNH